MTAEALATRRLIQYPLKPAADDEATTYLLQALPGRGEENVYYGTTRHSRFFKSKMKLGESGTTLSKLISSLRKIKVRQHKARGIHDASGAATADESTAPPCRVSAWKFIIATFLSTNISQRHRQTKLFNGKRLGRLPRRCVDESS